MTPLAAPEDVERRLERQLTNTELLWVEGLIEEASVKVLAHLRKAEDYYEDNTIPASVRIVTSRMVARVIKQNGAGLIPGQTQGQVTAGPFSTGTTFGQNTNTGAPWLTRSDREDLDNILGVGLAFGIDTLATTDYHDAACAINFGALYCSCGSDIAGLPIYGIEP